MHNMDLDHINLPPSVVADLYATSLIEPNETVVTRTAEDSKETRPAASPNWRSLGENKKHILIIVRDRDAVYLPDNDLAFLTDILVACKLSLADVAIVNLNNHPDASCKELSDHFRSKIVLLFAVEPASFGLPMRFPHFQIQPFDGNSFLFSPSLKELENDKVLKSKLWVCLKRLFNL